MGLHVKVYGNINITDNESDASFVAYVIDDNWKDRIKHLEYGKPYVGDVIYDGVDYPYRIHNQFRAKLVMLLDRQDLLSSEGKIKWAKLKNDVPFYELLEFADNEGVMDWETASKLYLDFVKYDEKAKNQMNTSDYRNYNTWLETFQNAKHSFGAVVFN